MRSKSEEYSDQDIGRSFRWVRFVFISGAVLIILLAFFSYSPRDAASLAGGVGSGCRNYVGVLGAMFSRGLFLFCGIGAYLAVGLLVLHLIRGFFSGKINRKLFWSGWVLMVFGAMLLLALDPLPFANLCDSLGLGRKALPESALSGGVIGQVLAAPEIPAENIPAGIMRQLIGSGGVLICGWVLTFCGAILIFFGDLFTFPWRILTSAGNRIKAEYREVRFHDEKEDVEDDGKVEMLTPDLPEAPLPEPKEKDVFDYPEIAEIDDLPVKSTATPAAKGLNRPAAERPLTIETPKVAIHQISSGEKVVSHSREYVLPPVTMLAQGAEVVGEDLQSIAKSRELLQNTLDDFGIAGKVSAYVSGPRVTRFEITLDPGVKVNKVEDLQDNIAMNLSASQVRILAPIPGRPVVGVEVSNHKPEAVFMRSVIESDAWMKSGAEIPLALGKDIAGKPVIMDLAKAPHLLIAGTTGTGKSVCTNSIIISLLFHFRPDELKLIMVDPKVVEFEDYRSLPHLLTPLINDSAKVPIALRWAVNEMERRYRILAKGGVKKIVEYNHRPASDEEILDDDGMPLPEKLPYVVIIIDELADLMMTEARKDVEKSITRIAQKGRAAGIHIIVATQRPSTNIITGVIKANLPSRLCFQVRTRVDSQVVLDSTGAEKLLGMGDMLMMSSTSMNIERVQGAFVKDSDIKSIAKFVSDQMPQEFNDAVVSEAEPGESALSGGDDDDDGYVENPVDISPVVRKYLKSTDDDTFRQALEIIVSEQKASTSYIQRRLKIGYNRAAEIVDQLEERGIVGPPSGSGSKREILIVDDLINLDSEDNGDA